VCARIDGTWLTWNQMVPNAAHLISPSRELCMRCKK
jgi:hypothetical protein